MSRRILFSTKYIVGSRLSFNVGIYIYMVAVIRFVDTVAAYSRNIDMISVRPLSLHG
jgi:hypothetical protein